MNVEFEFQLSFEHSLQKTIKNNGFEFSFSRMTSSIANSYQLSHKNDRKCVFVTTVRLRCALLRRPIKVLFL